MSELRRWFLHQIHPISIFIVIFLGFGNIYHFSKVDFFSYKQRQYFSILRNVIGSTSNKDLFKFLNTEFSPFYLNQFCVLRHILTNMSITGTSINTPTTVARDAPDDRPKSIVEVAIATSK